MFQSFSAYSILKRTAATAALVAAVIGTAHAGPKPGDKTWTVTLGPADHGSMDKKPWKVELFDAVACQSMSAVTVTQSGSVTLHVAAREGAGSATAKGEFGGHFRWRTQGVVPLDGKKTTMWFEGEGKPTRDGAGPFKIIIYPANGTGSAPTISGSCDR